MFFFSLLLSCADPTIELIIDRSDSEEITTDWSLNALRENIPSEADFSYFARISLDLRSKRPSEEELSAYEENPENLEAFVEQWLDEPDFARQIAWYWNDAMHTAVWAAQADIWSANPFDTRQALGWEPLSFIEHIVANDLPFETLVTMEEMPTNEIIGEIWGMEGDSSWSLAEPIDGRPMAGILSSRFLWTRYKVDFLNENRRRANHFSRMFLCHDYLDRDVDFSFDVLTESLDNMDSAIRSFPACTSCHASLDPLASFFGAFQLSSNLSIAQTGGVSQFKTSWYSNLRPPSYFGRPGRDISDLGKYVAQDPRFYQCSVERIWEGLFQTSPTRDTHFLSLVKEFNSEHHSIRSLVKRIVLSSEYRQQERRILRPEQLSGILQDVLGLEEGNEGSGIGPIIWSPKHRLLFGASDDYSIMQSNASFTIGNHLILEWLAKPIADQIDQDLRNPPDQRQIVLASSSAENEVRNQLQRWAVQLLSRPIDANDSILSQLLSLWQETNLEYGPTSAWTTTFLALLHHPDAVMR